MKKVFFMTVAFITAMTAIAQNEVGQLTLQPKIGLNIATLTGESDLKPYVRTVSGLELELGATEFLGIVAGVHYSQQGAKYKDANANFKFEYVNVPIMAQFYPVKGLALKTGVQLGFNAKKRLWEDGTSIDIDDAFTIFGVESKAKTFDLSIPFGISYEYANIVIDARYNLGMIGVLENVDGYKNSVFAFTIGYKIPVSF